MIIRVCAFTDRGMEIVEKIQEQMPRDLVEIRDHSVKLEEWTGECFQLRTPIVFVGATGIAVRAIAPFVADKLSDSPVIVIDEKGCFVIPILSGHIGGANLLAAKLAGILNADLVVTTATDINGLFSVDLFAVRNGLKIVNREGIRKVSSKLLAEKEITMAVEDGIEVAWETLPKEVRTIAADGKSDVDVYVSSDAAEAKDALLSLTAKQFVLGLGCKKGTEYELINKAANHVLKEAGITPDDVANLASIDLKDKERGLLLFSSINHIPFVTFSAAELEALDGEFSESDFVKSVTGVSNVCERAAMAAAGEGAELIFGKRAYDGVTVALAKRKVVLHG